MKSAGLCAAVSAAALIAACASPAENAGVSASPDLLSGADRCAAGAAISGFPTGAQTAWVEADGDVPAFCEVTATLTPVDGSAIGVVYRLPEGWNGKVLGFGGGGWAGNVRLDTAAQSLAKGYATMQTDGGHATTDIWNNTDWFENPESLTDFAHRAVHEMTVAGKSVVSAYYGEPHDKAYFQGCSTGGRMALMEAQRYPSDYDAIISGAPVYTFQVQTSGILRNNVFAIEGAQFSADDLQMVSDAVLAQCDMDDGLADGVVGVPRQCGWQPSSLQCAPGQSEGCLSEAQVGALGLIYGGIRASDGEWAMMPMSKGGEAGWTFFVSTAGQEDRTNGGGLMPLWPVITDGRPVDFSRFDPDADVSAVRSTAFAAAYEAKDPDLAPFFAAGGKLILWHGESDAGPSPVGTNDYAAAVRAATGAAADTSMRHFLLPGVGHCSGGPGADVVDWIDAIDAWETTGVAPEELVATKRDGSRTRKLCAAPNRAVFSGEGDANDPANWSCVSG